MPAFTEITAHPSFEEKLSTKDLAKETARLIGKFKKSAGEPPKFIDSRRIQLRFERIMMQLGSGEIGEREELRVHKEDRLRGEEVVIVVAGKDCGGVCYFRLDTLETYSHSREAVAKTEDFLDHLNHKPSR